MSRAIMLAIARSFNEYVEPENVVEGPKPSPRATTNGDGATRPGDDFNRRADWGADVIEPAGWTRLRGENGNGRVIWKRPGKDDPGGSATTGFCTSEAGNDLLYVFSTNATPFQAGRGYSKFAAYALLNFRGDYQAASRALGQAGYGDASAPAGRMNLNGHATKDAPDAGNSDDPLDADATAFDLIVAQSTVRWAWEKWLPVGVLTILASEPGCGKTRFCADLARRVAGGLSWPDGTAQTFPAGSPTLWVPADNQHAELGSLPTEFGFMPNLLYLNATRRNPFTGTMLDTKEDLATFERRIARIKPALVFVDTCLNATDRTAHKPEDAKAFFKPLQEIAARQQIVLILVTHLNAAGKPLGRRIEGQGRLVMMLECPDPDGQQHRRKLWVKKSNSLFPPALGVTMGDRGNEYDLSPPSAPATEPGRGRHGPSPERLEAACDWLTDVLRVGPARVGNTRTKAEAAGFDAKLLYRARDTLGVEEFEMESRKWWRLRTNDSQNE